MLSNKNLGYFIITGVCLMAALILVQVHWTRQAFKANQENWKQQVKEQLYIVGNDILISKNEDRTPRVLPISNQQYRIKLATKASVEEIKKALNKNLAPFTDQKYRWSLIDVADDSLVFVNTSQSRALALTHLNTIQKDIAITFPDQKWAVAQSMDLWWLSSIIVVLLVGFFGIALFRVLKEKRLKEVREDFISNMTHELKTPVSGIQLATEVLRDHSRPMDEATRDRYYEVLDRESQKLQKHIDQVLDWSLTSKKELPLKFEALDMSALLNEAVDRFLIRTKGKGKIKMAIQKLSRQVRGDMLHLSNAIDNLLVNAEKYAKGTPEVELKAREVNEGIELIISDKGIGIPQNHIKKIFHRFFRVPQSVSNGQNGHGLGLYYTSRVINAHHGSIDVESQPEKGTSMKMFLPYA